MINRHNVGKAYPQSTYLRRAKETEPIGLVKLCLVVSNRWAPGLEFLMAYSIVVTKCATVAMQTDLNAGQDVRRPSGCSVWPQAQHDLGHYTGV